MSQEYAGWVQQAQRPTQNLYQEDMMMTTMLECRQRLVQAEHDRRQYADLVTSLLAGGTLTPRRGSDLSNQVIESSLGAISSAIETIQREMKNYGDSFLMDEKLFQRIRTSGKQLAEGLEFGRQCKRRTTGKRDFLEVLPVEVVFKVFGYLDQKDLIQSLRTCQKWYSILALLLAESPRLRAASGYTADKFLSLCGGRHVHSLTVIPQLQEEEEVLLKLSQVDTGRLSLDINSERAIVDTFDNVKNLLGRLSELHLKMNAVQDSNNLNPILATLTGLHSLELAVGPVPYAYGLDDAKTNYFHDLRSLDLSFQYHMDLSSEVYFVEAFLNTNKFPNLASLRLNSYPIEAHDLRQLVTPQLKSLDLDDLPFVSFHEAMEILKGSDAKLRKLSLCQEQRGKANEKMDTDSFSGMSSLSELEELKIRDTSISYRTLLEVLKATDKHLRVLELSENSNLHFDESFDFAQVKELCPNIEKLSLVNCTGLTDCSCDRLSKSMGHTLSVLDLSRNNLTRCGVESLLSGGRHRLRRLSIRKCTIDREFVDYLNRFGSCSVID